MATPVIEAFSLTHAAIIDGDTGLDDEFGDIFGVNSGSLEVDADSFDNTGDDVIRSRWNWLNNANVAIQAGYIPFRTIELMTGTVTTSSGSGLTEGFSMPLWEINSINPAPRPVRLRMLSKDKEGNPRTLDIILFKVQFAPITFDGPAYKDGLKINYAGTALFSDTDDAGNPVLDSRTGAPSEAVGRLHSFA